jgi:uncharacterized membrane protein YjgN (DUF898 family)
MLSQQWQFAFIFASKVLSFGRSALGRPIVGGGMVARKSGRFQFDGGAGTFLGTGILAALITICTLGICYPFAMVVAERWRAKHTYIDGQRLVFTGSAMGLFGLWVKWLLLSIITLGIYSFWVVPRLQQWKVENTDFDPTWQPGPVAGATVPAAAQGQPAPHPTTA